LRCTTKYAGAITHRRRSPNSRYKRSTRHSAIRPRKGIAGPSRSSVRALTSSFGGIETGTSLPRPIERERRSLFRIEPRASAVQTSSQSGNRLNYADARRSAMRNTRGGGAGGRCRWSGRQRPLWPIRWNGNSEAWSACQNGWHTRPMNLPGGRTHRPDLPEYLAALSRMPRSTGANARIADFYLTKARQRRSAACRESTEPVRDRFARRPRGCSRPKPSVASRIPGPEGARVPRSRTAPVVGNNRVSTRDGRRVTMARAHTNRHEES
jgi:hypothetical protein